jgi:ankyrin repeat protein
MLSIGDLLLDVIPIVARVDRAAELSHCLYINSDTYRKGDLGATNYMIKNSLRVQCGDVASMRKAKREDFDVIQPRYQSSINMDVTTIEGTTQLIRASILNNLPRVLLLIQLGAPLHLVDKRYEWTALHWACRFGHEHIVEALLAGKYKGVGLNVDIYSGFLQTPLMIASLHGKINTMRLLLSRGAKILTPRLFKFSRGAKILTPRLFKYKNPHPGKYYYSSTHTPLPTQLIYENALHFGVKSRSRDVVELLLTASDADEAIQHKTYDYKETPLDIAMYIGAHPEICEILTRALDMSMKKKMEQIQNQAKSIIESVDSSDQKSKLASERPEKKQILNAQVQGAEDLPQAPIVSLTFALRPFWFCF